MMRFLNAMVALAVLILTSIACDVRSQDADLILHNGKIVTVDSGFSIHSAIAVRGERILKVGGEDQVMRTRGSQTLLVDLQGKVVVPGLIDSHVHPADACMTEFDHPIPKMETIEDVLKYIASRASQVKAGEWIHVRQVFITRLKEQRYPTRQELDRAAPRNPVVFSTGPDASINSLALKLSGIDKDFKISDSGPGYIEKDAQTGEPTGILRSCTRFIKSEDSVRQPSEEDRCRRLKELFKDYNSVGITSIGDKDASPAEVDRYRHLRSKGDLSVRVSLSQHVDTIGPLEEIQSEIRKIGKDPLTKADPLLQIIGIKTYLDGGMLTGSAYMQEPWGLSKIYSIDDPNYRGLLFIPKERLLLLVETAVDSHLQYTAHSQGDAAVQTLLDVYDEISRRKPIRQTRPSITHCSFMSGESIKQAARLGVVIDLQPAWLYMDARTLTGHFGYDRLRHFIPLRSIFEAGGVAGGGSDHMQKIGSFRAVNPYNPFLGMWITLTRKAKWYEGQLHPEEGLSREQALRYYTSNNAHLLFREKETGSLEEGKLADLVVLDRDILTCALDAVKDTKVLKTYLSGKLVFDSVAGVKKE
ncbi:MAG: amidohydrolase [Acidobacteriota bacterium]